MARISPIILLAIAILAIAFFALGLIQLLIRCLIKRPSFSLNSQSNSFHIDISSNNPHTFQSQLHHLFQLHDSGLDRALIDALPVFNYKDIMGSKSEPFDCAVCLCEFSSVDKLKFLPSCSHAFHIHCIETWLLSNSTCPLCRSLIGDDIDNTMGECDSSCPVGANESFTQENAGPARVFSVRLGKFKNSSEGLEREDRLAIGVTSSRSIDARRCYSMGAFRYVVDDVDLQVAAATVSGARAKARRANEQCSDSTEIEGQRINPRSKGDSFSVSKIWQWSKKGKFSGFSDGTESFVLAMPNRSDLV